MAKRKRDTEPATQASIPARAPQPLHGTSTAAVRVAFTVDAPTPPPPLQSKAAKTKRKAPKRRKTLTSRARKAIALDVLAEIEAQKFSNAAAAAPPPAAAAPAAPASAAVDPAAIRNLGKAWAKKDLTTLARLAEDPVFLAATIPEHPPPGAELDWVCISKHFGRYSCGGTAVKQQYQAVVRLMKEARREGKKGSNYVDLVKKALGALPEGQGTIYEIQAVLKKTEAKHLDKYKVKGQVRWKKAVGEVLREETGRLFENAAKTASGKIIWRLRQETEEQGEDCTTSI